MKRWCSPLLIFFACNLAAQLPETDIWLFSLRKEKSGKTVPEEPHNITNRKGYDNQPSFSQNGRFIYFSSVRDDQADLFEYDTKKKTSRQLTFTSESEYSPRNYSGDSLLAAVVVEQDSAQRIHILSGTTGKSRKKLSPDSVGYYTFLSADTVVFYKLGEPSGLYWQTTNDAREHFLAANVCRTFWTVNRHAIIYGVKDSARVRFYIYDFALMKAKLFATFSPVAEDTWWHRVAKHRDELLIAHNDKILRFSAVKQEWETLYDLSGFGIRHITRFVFDPEGKRLAVVDNADNP